MDKEVRYQLGLQGKRFVEESYKWSTIEKYYLSLLEK
jgi:hypothetical protein